MQSPHRHLSLSSGVGLVITNTIGAGVFLSAGFMVQEMDAGAILLAWLVGAALAGCGAVAYGALAREVQRSGGEYRYLSELLHPVVGYIAGWASLFMGFAAPVAIDARAAGEYAKILYPSVDARIVGSAVIIGLTLLHAGSLTWSRRGQNTFALLKVGVVLAFVALGLAVGHASWPTWSPPKEGAGFPWVPLLSSQLWIFFAFSGWNAAIYASSEFRNPERDVPRATIIGWALVSGLYLLLNWVFVANLTPARAAAVFDHETTRITLGHLIAEDLLGPAGGVVASAALLMIFVGAASAMMLVGPRVIGAMAEDGRLPSFFAASGGRPPVGAVVTQGAIALMFLHTHSLLEAVQGVASVLLALAALSAAGVFRLERLGLGRPSVLERMAAALFTLGALVILGLATTQFPRVAGSLGALVVLGFIGWVVQRRRVALAAPSAPAAQRKSG